MQIDLKGIIIIAITLANLIILFTMKFNDLHHLEGNVNELKKDLKHYIKKLYTLAQKVAKLEGKISK